MLLDYPRPKDMTVADGQSMYCLDTEKWSNHHALKDECGFTYMRDVLRWIVGLCWYGLFE